MILNLHDLVLQSPPVSMTSTECDDDNSGIDSDNGTVIGAIPARSVHCRQFRMTVVYLVMASFLLLWIRPSFPLQLLPLFLTFMEENICLDRFLVPDDVNSVASFIRQERGSDRPAITMCDSSVAFLPRIGRGWFCDLNAHAFGLSWRPGCRCRRVYGP